MLQLLVFCCTVTINLHRVLGWILTVRYECRNFIVSIVVQTALLVSDTHTLNRNGWCEIGILLSDEVITLIERKLNHASHARVLIDVTNLRCCLKARFLSFF